MSDRASERRSRGWLWLLTAFLLLAAPAVLLIGLSDDGHRAEEHQGASAPGRPGSLSAELGMEHVHGLGINPADGLL